MSAKSIFHKARLVFGFPLLFAASFAWAEGEAPANNGAGACALDDRLANLETNAQNASQNIVKAGGKQVDVSSWLSKRVACKDKNFLAQRECLEACSANAQKGLGGAKAISALMNVVSGLTNQTCQQQQQASDQMQNGYNAYSAACKSTQAACNTACAEAESAAKKIISEAGSACAGARDPASCQSASQMLVSTVKQDDNKSDSQFIASKTQQCQKDFSNRLAGAEEVLKGIGQMLAGGKQCQEDSDATESAEEEKSCSELTEAEQLQRADCICYVSPFNPGCDNSQVAETPNFNGGDFASVDTSGDTPAASVSDNKENPLSLGKGGSTAAGAGGGLYGGAGGASGMGAAGAASAENKEGKDKLNSKIFEGEGGGGGGGGGGWGAFGAASADANGKGSGGSGGLRGLAGKKADPTLTGAGGRDNWQKVKTRYSDNRPTFLDE